MGSLTQRILARALAAPEGGCVDVMKLSIADWMACGIAGASEPSARAVRRMVVAEGGSPQATLFGGGPATARQAALHNGAASHALDYDDTHFAHIGHLSVAVLPAALAATERAGGTLGQFIDACLAGCEAATRMGLALGRSHYQAGFHQTATSGAFGAALAASLITDPAGEVRGRALGYASTRASGLKSQFGTDGKPLNAGMAASNGVEAADLALAGLHPDINGWEGPGGFIATHHGTTDAGFDAPGFLFSGVSHKFHACCHGLHAALEALSEALAETGPDIRAVDIRTAPRWATVCDVAAPKTGLEAKFSYRGVVALALAGHDTAALETFEDAAIRTPKVQAMMDRVSVQFDDGVPETGAEVIVTFGDRQVRVFHDIGDVRPFNHRKDRVRRKTSALIGDALARKIWQAVEADPSTPIVSLSQLVGPGGQ